MQVLKKGSRGNEVKVLQDALHLYPDGIFGKLTEESVKEFQNANGLNPDGIVGKQTWAKLIIGEQAGISSVFTNSKRRIDEIIVHCTATAEGKDFTIADITRWHKQRGFSTIGYHYVVYRDGSIHTGRDVNVAGAHCTGHNTYSIGVCYIGGCKSDGLSPKDTRTEAQKAALLKLLKDLKRLYPNAKIRGHRDFANKACPSFDTTKEYSMI